MSEKSDILFLDIDNVPVERIKYCKMSYKLNSIANEILICNPSTIVLKDIGKLLGISNTTVLNYAKGEIKDGFLAQVMYKAFKQYKT